MSCNTFHSIGSKFSPRILTPEQARARLVSIDTRIGYSTNVESRHNMKYLLPANQALVSKLDIVKYPTIHANVNTGTFTGKLIAEFAEWSGYSDQDLYDSATSPVGKIGEIAFHPLLLPSSHL